MANAVSPSSFRKPPLRMASSPGCLLLLLLLLPLTASAQSSLTLAGYIKGVEDGVNLLAGYVKELYTGATCGSIATCQCTRLSCANDLGGPSLGACGKPEWQPWAMPSVCGTNCSGPQVNFNESFIRLPPGVDVTQPKLQFDICLTKSLDPTLAALFKNRTDPGLIYMGFPSGLFRAFPGIALAKSGPASDLTTTLAACTPYDPRYRPWFVAATTGPKDIVLILDFSGSMGDVLGRFSGGSKADAVKNATIAVLGTLSWTDYITVVVFSDEANTLLYNGGQGSFRMMQATPDNIASLTAAVKNLKPGGATNFVAAFQEAFAAFTQAVTQSGVEGGHTSNCSRVILFLTDGMDTVNQRDAVFTTVATGQQQLLTTTGSQARILTYSLGTDALQPTPSYVLKTLACNNSGLWSLLPDGTNPLDAMENYYSILAGSPAASGVVVWSPPYQSFSGAGLQVTAVKAVYDSVGSLIAVVGYDVLVSVLQVYADTATVFDQLVAVSAQCSAFEPVTSECGLQRLRNASDPSSVCPAPAPTVASCPLDEPKVNCRSATSTSVGKVVCPVGASVPFSDDLCCPTCSLLSASGANSSTPGSSSSVPIVAIVGGVVGGVVGVALLTIVVCVLCKRRNPPEEIVFASNLQVPYTPSASQQARRTPR